MSSSASNTIDRFPESDTNYRRNTAQSLEELKNKVKSSSGDVLGKSTKKESSFEQQKSILGQLNTRSKFERQRLFSQESYNPTNPDNHFQPYSANDVVSCCNIERKDSWKGSASFTSVSRRDRAFAIDGLIWRSKYRPGEGDQVGPAHYTIRQWPESGRNPIGFTEKANLINMRARKGDTYWARKGLLATQKSYIDRKIPVKVKMINFENPTENETQSHPETF